MSVSLVARRHLLLRLKPINRALRAAAQTQKLKSERLVAPELTPIAVTGEQVAALLLDVDAMEGSSDAHLPHGVALEEGERVQEDELRTAAGQLGLQLPLDDLVHTLGLTPFEEEVVLLCAAPEINRAYERIYAYVLDDLNRRLACTELACGLTARTALERLERRRAVGAAGTLRRCGVVLPVGTAATTLLQELTLAPAALDFLLTGDGDPASLFGDPAEVSIGDGLPLPPGVNATLVERAGEELARGLVTTVGIWGTRTNGVETVVHAVARHAGRRLRLVSPSASDHAESGLKAAVQTASALGAILWLRLDAAADPAVERGRDAAARALGESSVPVIVSGEHAWRPPELLRRSGYLELAVTAPTYADRVALWASSFPEVSAERVAELASTFRMGAPDLHAIANVARTRAAVTGAPVADTLTDSSRIVVRQRSEQFSTLVVPRRDATDLILPPALHDRVIEIATFYRAWPAVAERAAVGRLSSSAGLKALLIGEPGTGKTLAAEVVAAELGLPLLKVDLARITSRWVGESEKNLDELFREAEQSHLPLLFDEAESIFGKRGEIRHGSDRFANLEVSYLLQRLEQHDGLVMLASNLKDEIDPAFTRRFHVIVHFPRPGLVERRRLWTHALGSAEDGGGPAIDVEPLAALDLTGAGIVSTVRTAWQLAADRGTGELELAQLVEAVGRQFQREGRILNPATLGPYAPLLSVPAHARPHR
jgi:hypothetical protein